MIGNSLRMSLRAIAAFFPGTQLEYELLLTYEKNQAL